VRRGIPQSLKSRLRDRETRNGLYGGEAEGIRRRGERGRGAPGVGTAAVEIKKALGGKFMMEVGIGYGARGWRSLRCRRVGATFSRCLFTIVDATATACCCYLIAASWPPLVYPQPAKQALILLSWRCYMPSPRSHLHRQRHLDHPGRYLQLSVRKLLGGSAPIGPPPGPRQPTCHRASSH
jgi:hypothetical protein